MIGRTWIPCSFLEPWVEPAAPESCGSIMGDECFPRKNWSVITRTGGMGDEVYKKIEAKGLYQEKWADQLEVVPWLGQSWGSSSWSRLVEECPSERTHWNCVIQPAGGEQMTFSGSPEDSDFFSLWLRLQQQTSPATCKVLTSETPFLLQFLIWISYLFTGFERPNK